MDRFYLVHRICDDIWQRGDQLVLNDSRGNLDDLVIGWHKVSATVSLMISGFYLNQLF